MWIRKGHRDRLKGVNSPMPTQLVSNEEFIPRRQSQQQKEVEYWVGQIADEKSKKLGMDRRKFMASSMGLATCFLAANKVWARRSTWMKPRPLRRPLTTRSGPK